MTDNLTISGTVIKGRGLGAELGVPTANIEIPEESLDQIVPGIYASLVRLDEAEFLGATHIGKNVTLDDAEAKCETHILDFHDDIYGQEVAIELVKKIRDTIKFESLEDMTDAMKMDIAEAKEVLKDVHRDN